MGTLGVASSMPGSSHHAPAAPAASSSAFITTSVAVANSSALWCRQLPWQYTSRMVTVEDLNRD